MENEKLDVDLENIDITEMVKKSPLLARLIEEVRNDPDKGGSAYNRMHNRHNRSLPRPSPPPWPGWPKPPDETWGDPGLLPTVAQATEETAEGEGE